jgi:hypothetical protein
MTLEKHPVGSRVTVWYNPGDPTDAVIEQAGATKQLTFAGISLVLGMAMLVKSRHKFMSTPQSRID